MSAILLAPDAANRTSELPDPPTRASQTAHKSAAAASERDAVRRGAADSQHGHYPYRACSRGCAFSSSPHDAEEGRVRGAPCPALPCGLQRPGRRRARVGRETGTGAASGAGAAASLRPILTALPGASPLLTRTLQVVARLHGGWPARLRPRGPPARLRAAASAPLRAAGAGPRRLPQTPPRPGPH